MVVELVVVVPVLLPPLGAPPLPVPAPVVPPLPPPASPPPPPVDVIELLPVALAYAVWTSAAEPTAAAAICAA
ncbi:MAG: hypothetical protein GC182_13315 [Rhodopseudomonas sp.]|nr:hypothetical protein [Rhodopseudomonas sp.]